jgi:adenosylcobinamide kinase/adenosylcobinamide-phosphate guanylyltransferase
MIMEKELILILGGARSGKSAYADQLASQSGRSVLYVATATAGDAEMAARIAAHKAVRPENWHTLEIPLHIAQHLKGDIPIGSFILIDCLSLLASNVLLSLPEPVSESDYQAALSQEIGELLQAFRTSPAQTLVIVSNEVGMGLCQV